MGRDQLLISEQFWTREEIFSTWTPPASLSSPFQQVLASCLELRSTTKLTGMRHFNTLDNTMYIVQPHCFTVNSVNALSCLHSVVWVGCWGDICLAKYDKTVNKSHDNKTVNTSHAAGLATITAESCQESCQDYRVMIQVMTDIDPYPTRC